MGPFAPLAIEPFRVMPYAGGMSQTDNPMRSLPSVNAVLETAPLPGLQSRFAQEQLTSAVRAELDVVRNELRESANGPPPDAAALARRVAQRLEREERPNLRPVINATGIVLHTNLGRAPLAEEAVRAAGEAAGGYLNLELDLADGKRSSRQSAVRPWLCRLSGAESATVVNNCAAATIISLRALAQGREVIVSRGQLIEIGGGFRIPEIMAVSGAVLREVGTTNITRIADFEAAIGPNTAALMRVHTSNYRITGHTAQASLAELVELGHNRGLPVIDDVGSGALIDFARFGFTGEPVLRQSIAAGADLALCSGDKLLGGPQAGIIVGKKPLIQKIERDPLMRAFRLDKVTLAALEATLRLYVNEGRALREVPVLRMLAAPLSELRARAEALAAKLRAIPGLEVKVEEATAYVGGGSLPEQELKSAVVSLAAKGLSDEQLAQRLRAGEPAVLARVQSGRLLLDLRTVFAVQEEALVAAVRNACAASGAA